jgi:hypothetical protein
MNIKLAPAVGIKEQRGQFRASGDSAGAKAQPPLWPFAARLKSCPVTSQQRFDRLSRLPEQS